MIAVHDESAAGTGILSLGEGELLPVSAPVTILSGVGGIHGNEFSASVCSFAGKICDELSPCRIHNALGKTAIVNNPVALDVLHGNHPKAIDYFSGFLMSKVCALIGYTLVNARNYFARLCPFKGSLLCLRQFALSISQRLLFFAEKAGIFNYFSCRERGEVNQSNIYSNLFNRFWKKIGFAYTGESSEPLSGSFESNATGLYFPFDRTMKGGLDSSYLGNSKTPFCYFKPSVWRSLRKSKTVVSVVPSKARITRGFSCFYSSEEGLKSQVYSKGDILKNLAMNPFQGRSRELQGRKSSVEIVQPKRFFSFFPCRLSLIEKIIIKPATFSKSIQQKTALFFCWIESKFKVLMHKFIITQEPLKVKED